MTTQDYKLDATWRVFLPWLALEISIVVTERTVGCRSNRYGCALPAGEFGAVRECGATASRIGGNSVFSSKRLNTQWQVVASVT